MLEPVRWDPTYTHARGTSRRCTNVEPGLLGEAFLVLGELLALLGELLGVLGEPLPGRDADTLARTGCRARLSMESCWAASTRAAMARLIRGCPDVTVSVKLPSSNAEGVRAVLGPTRGRELLTAVLEQLTRRDAASARLNPTRRSDPMPDPHCSVPW